VNGWTLERRQRQAALIRSWKPYERSTGPKSEAGKAAVARNAQKHGLRSAEGVKAMREARRLLDVFDAQISGAALR